MTRDPLAQLLGAFVPPPAPRDATRAPMRGPEQRTVRPLPEGPRPRAIPTSDGLAAKLREFLGRTADQYASMEDAAMRGDASQLAGAVGPMALGTKATQRAILDNLRYGDVGPVGVLGDALVAPATRRAYEAVAETPVYRMKLPSSEPWERPVPDQWTWKGDRDTRAVFEFNAPENPRIVVIDSYSDPEDMELLFHEGAHALRNAKGRPFPRIGRDPFKARRPDEYINAPFEQSARRMATWALQQELPENQVERLFRRGRPEWYFPGRITWERPIWSPESVRDKLAALRTRLGQRKRNKELLP